MITVFKCKSIFYKIDSMFLKLFSIFLKEIYGVCALNKQLLTNTKKNQNSNIKNANWIEILYNRKINYTVHVTQNIHIITNIFSQKT